MEILCYNKNKIIYQITIKMNEEDLIKQIKKGVLTYFNPNRGIEIINLRSFDKVLIVGNGFMDWTKYEV